MKKLFSLAITVSMIWFVTILVRPYWDRYLLQLDIAEAAIYGTKTNEYEARKFLFKKMKEKRRSITVKDVFIVKDDQKNVYVKMSYTDEIEIAGRTLMRVQFTVHATEAETIARL
ncbi:MAG: hypothetical protein CVU64_01370 [Deltaproteobacteria bacterium HGW-Deltaproteobacteria-21]|nr:MAG: hypothetical protein CVU64_01370 [Deltaproteobacteria bacterium HGW-Deltaproteobacteria-21]